MNELQKEQMRQTRAFDGISFDPEKRIEQFIVGIDSENSKIDELCQKYGVDSQKLKDKYFKLALDYLYAESRCLSWTVQQWLEFLQEQPKNTICKLKRGQL